MAITPNMELTLPVTGSTPGPDWADLLNTAFNLIDSHDHSSSKGVKITPAGLNINSDLDIGANNIINVDSIRLNSTTVSGINGIYQNNGNLFWRNGAGTNVQITAGGTINVGSLGTIGGDYSTDPNNPLITFTTATGAYDFFKNTTGTPIPGSINSGKVTIFQEIASANGITLQSPASVPSAYSLTFPLTQAAANNSLISVSAAGVMSFTRTPTVNTLGINAGLVSALSLYNETDTDTGMFFSASDTIDFVNGGNKSLVITSDRVTEFKPAAVTNIQPNPGTIKVGNAGSGSLEPAIALYATGGGNRLNRIIGYMGTSDDVSSSTAVIDFNVRRNTDTPFGTKEKLFTFTNFNTEIFTIQREYIQAFNNNFMNDVNGAIFGSSNVSSWPTSAVGRVNGRWMFTSNSNTDPFIMLYQNASAAGSPGIRFQSLSNTSASASSTIKQYRPVGYAGNQGSGLTFRVQSTSGTEFDAAILDQDGSFSFQNNLLKNISNIIATQATIPTFNSTTSAITTINNTTLNTTNINASTVSTTNVISDNGSFTFGIQTAGNPTKVAWKKITGTLASTPGSSIAIAHSLTPSKILNIQAIARDGTTGYVSNGFDSVGLSSDLEVLLTNTTITIRHNLALLNSRPVVVLILFEI